MSTVRVDLVVDQKGTAAAGMKDLASKTQDAASASKQLNVERSKIKAEQSSKADEGGKAEEGVKTLAAAYAALRITEAGVAALAKTVTALGDASLTAAQRERAIAGAIPIIGGLATATIDLGDAMSGLTEKMRVNIEQFAFAKLAVEAQGRTDTARQRTGFESDKLNAGAAAQGKAAKIELTLPAANSGTLAGRRAYDEAERLLPLERQTITARANLEAITKQEEDAKKRFGELQGHGITLNNRSIVAAEDVGIAKTGIKQNAIGGANRVDPVAVLDATGKLVTARIEQQQNLNQLQEANNKLIELGTQKAQAGSAVRQTEIATARERLSILKDQVAAVQSQYQAFGGLNKAEQLMANQAAKQFKDFGLASLTKGQQEWIERGGGGDALALAREKAAEANPLTKDFRRNLGLPDVDLQDLRKQKAQATLNIDAKIALDAAELAQQLADKLGPLLVKSVELVIKQGEIEVQRAKAELLRGQAERR